MDYECKECMKKFRFRNDLKSHIKAVHKKIKDLECDECSKRFSDFGNLKGHKISHEGRKDFESELWKK